MKVSVFFYPYFPKKKQQFESLLWPFEIVLTLPCCRYLSYEIQAYPSSCLIIWDSVTNIVDHSRCYLVEWLKQSEEEPVFKKQSRCCCGAFFTINLFPIFSHFSKSKFYLLNLLVLAKKWIMKNLRLVMGINSLTRLDVIFPFYLRESFFFWYVWY